MVIKTKHVPMGPLSFFAVGAVPVAMLYLDVIYRWKTHIYIYIYIYIKINFK